MSGFGNFILHEKQARPGRNPRTGEPADDHRPAAIMPVSCPIHA
ncbi:HU family DNA-binding protein [Acidithiobacillus sp.]